MNSLLIIYPHWYPSNLAGVHRPRLIGNFLEEFGWKPLILTVKPEFYEEPPDPDIHLLFSPAFTEYRVNARKIGKFRFTGDIGLRAFTNLYSEGKRIIQQEKPDFLWIPIPSFYTALLGRFLHFKTGIPYGIDYIDPWIYNISGDRSLRATLSLMLAKFLEPIAVKKASLITGVAYEYYKPVLDRNFKNNRTIVEVKLEEEDERRKIIDERKEEKSEVRNQKSENLFSDKVELSLKSENSNLESQIPTSHVPRPTSHVPFPRPLYHCYFPYGFDPHDHEIEIPSLSLPWDDKPGCIPIVYAGAFMPNSQMFLNTLFRAFSLLAKNNSIPANVHMYFLGTGMYTHKSITAYAADNGISSYVTEIRERFPFLHILNFLSKAGKLLIIGSTEKHYTASKTFQVILSKRPFLGMFHHESSAVQILKESNTGNYLITYHPDETHEEFLARTTSVLQNFLAGSLPWSPDLSALKPYSAKSSARKLVQAIEKSLIR